MKVVFLDRDGVVNEFPGNGQYVTKLKDFHFIPGSLEAIRYLTEEGFTIFIISNQAGVGKGIYSLNKLNHITKKMLREAEKAGGKIKGAFYCIHRSDAECTCRKPETGSMEKAMKSINMNLLDAKGSFFVGDTKSDVLTGFNAKLQTIFVLTGRARLKQAKNWGIKPDYIVKNLLEASKIISGQCANLSQYKTQNIILKI